MQHILNEEEYETYKIGLEAEKHAAKTSLLLMKIRNDLLKENDFTCIHETKTIWYCDDCPVSPLKHRDNYKEWKLLCGRQRSYSK